MFSKKVYSAPLMSGYDVKKGSSPNEKVVRVEYTDKVTFKKLAKLLGIMDDFKVIFLCCNILIILLCNITQCLIYL